MTLGGDPEAQHSDPGPVRLTSEGDLAATSPDAVVEEANGAEERGRRLRSLIGAIALTALVMAVIGLCLAMWKRAA